MNKGPEEEIEDQPEGMEQNPAGLELPFAIVGIGAGKGSIEALVQFFKHMPEGADVAFVVISKDIDMSCKDLQTILSEHASLPVIQAADGQVITANTIYLTPEDTEIGLHQQRLLFFESSSEQTTRMPVDHFFESLANDQGASAVGIVLSGIDADGETGIRMIKEKFGMAMAQYPESAEFPTMPAAAVRTKLIDFNLSAEKLPLKLVEYLRHPAIQAMGQNNLESPDNEVHIQKILMLLRASTGHDFTLYKKNTILRRIERRIAFHQFSGCEDYISYLREHPVEVETLFNELLINVTKFFRDKQAFDTLRTHLYHMLESKGPDDTIRIWIAGCSTGEEAYSIAILLAEYLEQSGTILRSKPQIFATDLDANAIEHARSGFYFSNIVSELDKTHLSRFFIEKNNGYMVKKEIREMIVFAQHNLAKDAPFTRLDLLCCRNVMIYLTSELQKKILPIFHYSLNARGLLFLGPAESINGFQEIFDVVESKWKIFRRKNGLSAIGKFLDFPFQVNAQDKITKSESGIKPSLKNPLAEHFNSMLLKKHTPAAFLLSDKGEIVYVNGNTNRYVELHAGEAVMNIHRMIREDLKYVLSNAFHQARRQRTTVTVNDIKIKDGNKMSAIGFTVTYLDETPLQGMILVTFSERDLPKRLAKGKQGHRVSMVAVEELEEELNHTKQQLHTTIEQMETSLEELTSTNEELQSTNEELQSTNEEALTTKEEMQSLNEELMTINHQYQTKAEELTQLNNDMKNLLDNIEIGTIFLDNKLQILRFTPQITKLFNLIPMDVGRSITHIVSNVDYPAIEDTIYAVIDTLVGKELEVRTKNDEWYDLRIMPYRTMDNFINGAVLTFTKITSTKSLRSQFSGLLRYTCAMIQSCSNAVILLDDTHKTIVYNNAFLQFSCLTKLELSELSFLKIVSSKWQMSELAQALTADEHIIELTVYWEKCESEPYKLKVSLEKLVGAAGEIEATVVTFHIN